MNLYMNRPAYCKYTFKYTFLAAAPVSVLIFAGALASVSAGLLAQATKQATQFASTLPSPYAAASATLKNGNDLAPLLALRQHQAEYTDTPDGAWDYWQALAVCQSRAADYAGALESTSKVQTRSFGKADKPDAAAQKQESQAEAKRLATFAPQNALSTITQAARKRRVVMINEAHHVPQHRVFTTRLLTALYKQGYRWFAAETLNAADAGLNRRGYPLRQTGFYTNEPTYAELIRTALRLGYHVVAYEAEGKGEMTPGMSRGDMLRAQNER